MKITVKEVKCGEALSPKMQQRLKIKAWQNATLKLKGFEEAGYSFLDLWEDGKCNPICVAAEGKPTQEEATAAAKKMFDDFDEYVDVSSDFVPEGGPDGEDLWFPAYALKKTFANLPEDEGLTILSEISDVLYKVLVGDKRRGRHESNEEISPKLQDRLKFKEFAQFFNELPFFGQTIGDPLDTVRKEGLGYGVGNGSKEEQEEAAKEILSDFDDYVSWTTDQDPDGSWYIKMTFKPELWALPIEELKKVFGLLDDAFGPWS